MIARTIACVSASLILLAATPVRGEEDSSSAPQAPALPAADPTPEAAVPDAERLPAKPNRNARQEQSKQDKRAKKEQRRAEKEQRKAEKERRKAEKRAQQLADRPAPGMRLLLGPGISLGGFYPSDVNRYMSNWRDRYGLTIMQSGTTDMYLSFVPRLSLSFAPIPYLELQAVGEIGWSPKYIVIEGGDSRFFTFTRYSAGTNVIGHLPLRQYRNSLFLGGGLMFHALRFEEYAANALGYRGLLGFRFNGKRFSPEILLAFDYVNAGTGRPINEVGGGEMELSYSSVMLGGNFYFSLL